MENHPVISIAIADDHIVVREGLVSLLTSLGFQITIQADNGQCLIDSLEQSKSLPDVCILDVNMPVLNGLETIILLKKIWADMPVLILTIGDNSNIVKRMLMEGANGYLLKNCSVEELRKAITSVCGNGVYFSEIVSKQLYKAIRSGGRDLDNLSAIEIKVLEYCCNETDLSYEEIGIKMGLSKKSVENHRDTVFRRLNVHSRAGLVRYAIQNGLITLDINCDNGKDFFQKRT